MKLRDIDLNLLLAFEALMQARSVSKGAARLGIGQPAMSACLARLRSILADELFVRAAGAMQPTVKALALAPGIDAALAQLRQTFSEKIPFEPGTATRSFLIASTDYTTFVLGPALYSEINRLAPGVDLRILGYDKDDIPDLIDRGDIDLALGVFDPPPGTAVRQFLCPERFVGIVRRSHPALIDGAMSLDAYAAADHALVSVRRDARGQIDRALSVLGLSRRIALTLPHMLALPGILMASDLVSAVPSRVAAQFLGNQLVMFELPVAVPEWRIEMLWNPTTRTDQPSVWLRARIMAVAESIA